MPDAVTLPNTVALQCTERQKLQSPQCHLVDRLPFYTATRHALDCGGLLKSRGTNNLTNNQTPISDNMRFDSQSLEIPLYRDPPTAD